jgi:hypothetical protein
MSEHFKSTYKKTVSEGNLKRAYQALLSYPDLPVDFVDLFLRYFLGG